VRAILLAAGLGTRLAPITDTLPKCLVPINGKPLLDYWIEQLFNAGIERILINTHVTKILLTTSLFCWFMLTIYLFVILVRLLRLTMRDRAEQRSL
jgi:UTP-glucose-1-phosphate uridylyltransferase